MICYHDKTMMISIPYELVSLAPAASGADPPTQKTNTWLMDDTTHDPRKQMARYTIVRRRGPRVVTPRHRTKDPRPASKQASIPTPLCSETAQIFRTGSMVKGQAHDPIQVEGEDGYTEIRRIRTGSIETKGKFGGYDSSSRSGHSSRRHHRHRGQGPLAKCGHLCSMRDVYECYMVLECSDNPT